jgi:hypothetical protein
VYLAVHREGVRTDLVTSAIWPTVSPTRPSNAFHSTLSQLRRTVRALVDEETAAFIAHRDGRYYLNPELVDVDLWRLTAALHAARTSFDQARTIALQEVVNLYRADLAEDYTGEWLDEPRETLRREVIDAHAALIRTTRQHEPERALGLLERARQLDPHNEAIYRDIMRLQSRLGISTPSAEPCGCCGPHWPTLMLAPPRTPKPCPSTSNTRRAWRLHHQTSAPLTVPEVQHRFEGAIMPTDEEIERRVEADDTPVTARRKTVAQSISALGAQIAIVSGPLQELIGQVRQEIGDNQDIITVEKLAVYTDISKADLKEWLAGYKPSGNKRKRQPVGETTNESTKSRRGINQVAAPGKHTDEGAPMGMNGNMVT